MANPAVHRSAISSIICERRKELKLTLEQLGALSGVSFTYIARIERGERFPSASILRKLAEPLYLSEIGLFILAGYLSRDSADKYNKQLGVKRG